MSRITCTLTAAVLVLASIVLPASGAGAQIPEPPTACPESDLLYPVSKCASWIARDNSQQAFASETSPDGSTVFALGNEYRRNAFATIAYNTQTGEIRWKSLFERPGGSLSNQGRDLAVAPDGGSVYSVGFTAEPGQFAKMTTVAYDAVTGAERWVSMFDTPEWYGSDMGGHVVVSPDSQTIYVAGESLHRNPDGSDYRGDDYRVLALRASDGSVKWSRAFDSSENQFGTGDLVEAVNVSPDGNHVVVTGRWGTADGYMFGTFSLNAVTGATEWFDRYTGGQERFDWPHDIAFTPDSSRVFVTGDSHDGFAYNRATVAYDTATGERAWVVRFSATGWTDFGHAVEVSPDGEVVYVTGESVGAAVNNPTNAFGNSGLTPDISTQALDVDTGEQIWEARYSVPRGSNSDDLVVSPDGRHIYVTGSTWTFTAGWNIVTLAYDAETGSEQWVARYSFAKAGIGDQDDWDPFISISPDGSRVFTVGTSAGSPGDGKGVVTLAYETAGFF